MYSSFEAEYELAKNLIMNFQFSALNVTSRKVIIVYRVKLCHLINETDYQSFD